MSMSRWWMLGAVLPLVAGCGGGSSSTDDRERFSVAYSLSAENIVEVVDGVATISKVDTVCNSTVEEDGVDVTHVLDLGKDEVVILFRMKWTNNDLDSQNVVLKGDGFKVTVYSVDESGERIEQWNSYKDYYPDAGDEERMYLESAVEGTYVVTNSDTGVDEEVTDNCNNENGRGDEDELGDASPLPLVYSHSTTGNLILDEFSEQSVVIPQSETLPATKPSFWGDIPYRDGVGDYLWRGFDLLGDEVGAGDFEADLEVTICLVDAGCEVLMRTIEFKVQDKAVESE